MKKILFSLLVLGLICIALVVAQMEKEQVLQPRWSESVTAQQKAVLQQLIDNMVKVEGGTFTMGATTEQGSDAGPDEKPTHSVTLSDYMIGKTEVTQEQWEAVMGNNPSYYKGSDLPVETVSWNDCQEFIKKLNSLTGLSFRLPTEAEWEYASRGGNKSRGYKYSGSNDIDKVAWYYGNAFASETETHTVATKAPNELGLYDMSGNVWEWCNDWDGDYSSYSQTNPTGPASGSTRVDRGGCWGSDAEYCRVSYRHYVDPTYGDFSLGLRLALDSDKPSVKDTTKSSAKNGLSPRWSASVTAQQKAVLQQLIDDMVKVQGGTFVMGATSEHGSDADSEERPVHSVTLSDYMIGKTEVTQEQWQAVMGSNPSHFKGKNRPVEQVSWYDCQEFIKKLNSLTGLNFRFPTEAEWEYAARGGNKSRGYKYSGGDDIERVAWYDETTKEKGTEPVATKSPNELGLYDMSGNVFEWCSDWYGDYSIYSQTNPTGPATGSYRVTRGGSWFFNASYCRVWNRIYDDPTDSELDCGLRLALGSDKPSVEETTKSSAKNGLSPRWSASVTAQQKAVLQQLIDNMVKVEGGTFTMGATSEQGSDAYDMEKPAHTVTLSDYMIGKTEVTQEQWQAVMGSNPSYFKGNNLPVECVSWNYCQEFIKKLNSLTGLSFRLPTEAEWEYAARGGNKSRGYKYSGGNDIAQVAWDADNYSGKTHAVATKAPNELGLYDMSGNVWEWCNDWYRDYSSSAQTNPTGPASGYYRVDRGGCWGNGARNCRVSRRSCGNPSYSRFNLGLRLALGSDKPSVEETTKSSSAKNGLSPRWSESVTAQQKAVLQQLIDNMVKVEGGTFTMGATSEQGGEAESDEKPTHSVTLSDYMIGKTEVTQEQWQVVMGSNPSRFSGNNLPVEQVSWNDCQEFIKKLNSLTGLSFRFPTEAEWEYAARGGNKSHGYKYSGGNDIELVAWYTNTTNDSGTKPVATKAPNELGLYDMSGNVSEWCNDWLGSYSSYSQTNPTGPATGSYRVDRGGSWFLNARFCRVSDRSHADPAVSINYLGLRIAL